MGREFSKIKVDTLTDEFGDIVSGSPEEGESPTETDSVQSETGESSAPALMGKQEGHTAAQAAVTSLR